MCRLISDVVTVTERTKCKLPKHTFGYATVDLTAMGYAVVSGRYRPPYAKVAKWS